MGRNIARRRWRGWVACLVVGLAAPLWAAAPAPESKPSTADMRSSILAKLDYDRGYFQRVLNLKASGKSDRRLSAEAFAHEVKRARLNLPVLDALFAHRDAYLKGQPLPLPKNDEVHRVYANLAAMLNMLQAAEAGNYKGVLEAGQRVVIRDRKNLGVVQNDDSRYYLNLYREYFYLMALAHYRLGRDAEAVRWMARIEADADVQELKKQISSEAPKDAKAERLIALRTRPVAVVAFANLDKFKETEWIAGGLPEVLTNDLVQHTDLLVVERTHIAKVLKEVSLSQAGITDEKAAKNVGQMLNAGTLVVGSYRALGNRVWLSLRLVDVEDGRALASAEGEAPANDLFPGARQVLMKLLGGVGWVDSLTQEELLASHAPKVDTVKNLLQARLLLASKSAQAKELYAQAVKDDPSYAKLFEDLKSEFAGISATLAVMPFVNASGAQRDMWMVQGVGQALSTDLPKIGFTVVERLQLLDYVKENGQIIDPDSARQVGTKVGADFIVLGSLLHQKPQLRIDARFVDVRTGIVTQTVSAEGTSEEFMQVLVTLSTEIARRFNEKLSEETLASLSGKRMSKEEFEKYVRQELAKESLTRSLRPTRAEDPNAPSRWPFWTAVGGAAAGATAAAVGLAMSSRHTDQVVYTDALLQFATRPEDQERLLGVRDREAASAQGWSAVGWSGLGVAAVSAGYLVYDTFFAPSPDQAASATASPVVPVAGATAGGAVLGVSGAF